MDTTLERIHVKIAELEARIGDLRVTERELLALEQAPAQRTRVAEGPKSKPKANANGPVERRSTIGAAISEALDQRGVLSATEIAEHIKAGGRDVSNRTVSFALQAMKKRGLVKNINGSWSQPKTRSKQAKQAR